MSQLEYLREVGYIGNFYKVPEYIFHCKQIKLKFVLCEKEKVTNEMFTFCIVRNVELILVEKKMDIIKIMKEKRVDFWIMCSFGIRLPMELLENVEVYNIHYAKLPYYKGRHPTFWATINNELEIGISLHEVSEKLDEGDIIAQELVDYYIWMDEDCLFDELTKKIPSLIQKLIEYKNGKKVEKKKNNEENYFSPVKEEDITILLNKDTPVTIFNKVRAQSKYKGARLVYNGREIWIKKISFKYAQFLKESDIAIPIRDDVFMLLEDYTKEV